MYLAWQALLLSGFGAIYLIADSRLELIRLASNELGNAARQGQTMDKLKSLSGRAEMWSAMWDSFLDAPWFGHGYYVTSRTGELYVWWEWGNWTAHNWFLQLLVTTGVIGVLLHFAGLASLAIHTRRFRQKAPALTTFVMLITGWFRAGESLTARTSVRSCPSPSSLP